MSEASEHLARVAELRRLIDEQNEADRRVGRAVRSAMFVAFKGPEDTDADYLRAAARRLVGGYDIGGSNVRATVARILRAIAKASS